MFIEEILKKLNKGGKGAFTLEKYKHSHTKSSLSSFIHNNPNLETT